MRIPLHALLLKPNVSAGANYLVVAAFALRYRSSTDDLDPALVTEVGDGLWRIEDGRHRFLGSVIAGRSDLLCELDEPTD